MSSSIASSIQVTTTQPSQQKAFDQATFSSYIGQTVSGTAVYAGRVNPVSLCVCVYIHKHARPVFCSLSLSFDDGCITLNLILFRNGRLDKYLL